MTHYQLDARNLLCPLPVIKTQNKVKDLLAGDELEILCTDPGVLQDIPVWCRMYGHEIINSKQENLLITIIIGRSEARRSL